MKKGKIAVAVFVGLIASVSFVKAEGFSVDFDKGVFGTTDFMEAVKTSKASMADTAAGIAPVPATALNPVSIAVYTLTTPGLQKLRKEVVNIPGLSKDFLKQINEEKTIVLYNESTVLLAVMAGGVQYVVLESNDKGLIDFLTKEEVKSPQREFGNKAAGLIWKCITKYETIMKWVNYVWTSVVISREVCSWQNDGTTPDTSLPGGSGSTWNSGQGGDSDYDVNKHRK